jgi:hypothetical protein
MALHCADRITGTDREGDLLAPGLIILISGIPVADRPSPRPLSRAPGDESAPGAME